MYNIYSAVHNPYKVAAMSGTHFYSVYVILIW